MWATPGWDAPPIGWEAKPAASGSLPRLDELAADAVVMAWAGEAATRKLGADESMMFESIRDAAPGAAERLLSSAVSRGAHVAAMFGPGIRNVSLRGAALDRKLGSQLAECTDCVLLGLTGCGGIDEDAVAEATARMPLRSVTLDGTVDALLSGAAAVGLAACPALERLDVRGTPLAEGAADAMLERCPSALRALRVQFSDVGGSAVAGLCARASALSALHLEGSKRLGALPAAWPPRLCSLELRGCTCIDPESLSAGVAAMLAGGAARHLGLAETGVSDAMLRRWAAVTGAPPGTAGWDGQAASETAGAAAEAPTAAAAAAAATPAAAAALAAAGGAGEGAGSRRPGARGGTGARLAVASLQSLDLSWNERLSPAALLACLERAADLRRLELRNVGCDCDEMMSDAQARVLFQACSRLETVVLTRCDGVGDGAAEALAALPCLGSLDLSWSQALSDAGLASLLAGSGAPLRHLRLEGCKSITEAGLRLVPSLPGAGALRSLELQWVNSAGAGEAAALRAGMPLARVVDYFGGAMDE